MVDYEFYLSEPGNLERACEMCELTPLEIEEIVGRFKQSHWRFGGLLRGQVQVMLNGNIRIIHHFTKRVLWNSMQ
jgi:hypothetical protein